MDNLAPNIIAQLNLLDSTIGFISRSYYIYIYYLSNKLHSFPRYIRTIG